MLQLSGIAGNFTSETALAADGRGRICRLRKKDGAPPKRDQPDRV
jgi:hypothetical protein